MSSSLIIPHSKLLLRSSQQSNKWSLLYCQACAVRFTHLHHERTYHSKMFSRPKRILHNPYYNSKYLICKYDPPFSSSSASSQFTTEKFRSISPKHVLPQPFPLASDSWLIHTGSLHNNIRGCHIRFFQTSTSWRKEESKMEKTVKAIKDSVKEAEEDKLAPPALKEAHLVTPKKTFLQKFVAGLKHYYHGFRLLFIDTHICSKLIWQLLNGKTLTRREYKQLVRTTADLFRLLPMLVFILVPFAEFLLPVVLHIFPNMLPSTFAEEKDEKEKIKKTLKARIEMAKFLQKTVEESALEVKKQDGQTVESFANFLDKIQDEGIKPRTKDVMKFAKLFENEVTLDNLTRQQLRACCIMLGITPMGSNALLRFLLQMKLRRLLTDDKMIREEGVESLTIEELQSANRARGMRALGISEVRLQEQLNQWITFHLDEKIPTSLLLLSRALYLPENLSTEEKIGATITQLAATAADEAKVKVAEMSGEKVDNKTKLDVIKREEAIIAEEKEEKEQMEMEAKRLEQDERDAAEAKAAATVMEVSMEDKAPVLETRASEILVDKAEEIKASPAEGFKEEEDMTHKDLDDMEDVLEGIAKERDINIEKHALKDLKEEVTEYKEDLEDLATVTKEKAFEESKAAKRLAKKVDRMISSLDKVVINLKEEKTSIEEQMSVEEQNVKDDLGDVKFSKEQIDKFKTNIISIDEMVDALKRMKKVPDGSKIKRIFEVFDEDKDGIIDLNRALKVLEDLNQEHLNLKASHLQEIIKVLESEAELEQAEKEKEKEEKEKMNSESQLKEQQKN